MRFHKPPRAFVPLGTGETVGAGHSEGSGRPADPGASAGLKIAPAVVPKPRKYRNEPVVVDERRFASKAEARRYVELRMLERAGKIVDLECQPRFPLVVEGEKIGTYVGDFQYLVMDTAERIVEDVKSPATRKLPAFRLKVKLVYALYGLRVREA